MANFGVKTLGKSNYYNVYKCVDAKCGTVWLGRYKNSKWFDTEREAAKWVDLQLIADGKEPKNVMKRKQYFLLRTTLGVCGVASPAFIN